MNRASPTGREVSAGWTSSEAHGTSERLSATLSGGELPGAYQVDLVSSVVNRSQPLGRRLAPLDFLGYPHALAVREDMIGDILPGSVHASSLRSSATEIREPGKSVVKDPNPYPSTATEAAEGSEAGALCEVLTLGQSFNRPLGPSHKPTGTPDNKSIPPEALKGTNISGSYHGYIEEEELLPIDKGWHSVTLSGGPCPGRSSLEGCRSLFEEPGGKGGGSFTVKSPVSSSRMVNAYLQEPMESSDKKVRFKVVTPRDMWEYEPDDPDEVQTTHPVGKNRSKSVTCFPFFSRTKVTP